jgi:hypothetical protein
MLPAMPVSEMAFGDRRDSISRLRMSAWYSRALPRPRGARPGEGDDDERSAAEGGVAIGGEA